MHLDYVWALRFEDDLERRLQTQVIESGLSKSIHREHKLISQRHLRSVRFSFAGCSWIDGERLEMLKSRLSTYPRSFVVRLDSQKVSLLRFSITEAFPQHIVFALYLILRRRPQGAYTPQACYRCRQQGCWRMRGGKGIDVEFYMRLSGFQFVPVRGWLYAAFHE